MTVDRDQTRRDAEKALAHRIADGPVLIAHQLAEHCLALLSELERAERTADRWETEARILREANERFGRNQT